MLSVLPACPCVEGGVGASGYSESTSSLVCIIVAFICFYFILTLSIVFFVVVYFFALRIRDCVEGRRQFVENTRKKNAKKLHGNPKRGWKLSGITVFGWRLRRPLLLREVWGGGGQERVVRVGRGAERNCAKQCTLSAVGGLVCVWGGGGATVKCAQRNEDRGLRSSAVVKDMGGRVRRVVCGCMYVACGAEGGWGGFW